MPVLATVFHFADMFGDSGYFIYFLLCFPLIIIIVFDVFNVLLLTSYYVIHGVHWVGVADFYTMRAVRCLSAYVSWTHLCVSFILNA